MQSMNVPKRFSSLTLIFPCLALLALSTSANAAPSFGSAIDQSQPVIDSTVGGLAIGGNSTQKLAQTVTVGLAGRLAGMYLPIDCESGRLVIQIRDLNGNEPGDVVLTQRRIRAARLGAVGPVFRFFRIGGGLSFAAGDRFALVLTNPRGTCAIFQGPLGDSYAGGEGFFDALPNPAGWVPFSDTETRLDLPMMTVMQLP